MTIVHELGGLAEFYRIRPVANGTPSLAQMTARETADIVGVAERAAVRIDNLERALVSLVDAVDSGDQERVCSALFVARGHTF
jgi:hypothetical protein